MAGVVINHLQRFAFRAPLVVPDWRAASFSGRRELARDRRVCLFRILEIAMARIRETEVSGERLDPAHDIQIEPPKRKGIGFGGWAGIVIFAAAIAAYAYAQGGIG